MAVPLFSIPFQEGGEGEQGIMAMIPQHMVVLVPMAVARAGLLTWMVAVSMGTAVFIMVVVVVVALTFMVTP
jgi:hypothetical protein